MKRKIKNIVLSIIFIVISILDGFAQINNRTFVQNSISLDDAFELALNNAFEVKNAKNTKKLSAIQFELYKAQLKPAINIGGNIPNYFQTSIPVTQPNGTISFQRLSQNNASISMTATQSIPYTGGQVFFQSDLTRFDDFTFDNRLFNGVPLRIGIIQPLFGRKPLKWANKIEPLQLEESIKNYNIDIEEVQLKTAILYSEIVLADEDYLIAKYNTETNEQLLLIAEQRFNLGKISRDEKLQIQIEVENAKLNLRKATRRKITALRNLGTFIGADLSDNILVAAYNEMVNITIDKSKAISYLRENRPELLRFQRRLLEAERDVSYSKLDNGPQIDLFASFGLARGSEFLSDIYSQPFTEQQVSLSINVPLVDWGKRKNEIHKAKLIQENIQDQETQFIQELENNLFLKILEFETNQQTIQDQKEILELANERYKIANERYILGNLDITNLSLAQKEKDLSQRNYIEAISSYWINYYEIRLLTGFDFLNNKLIEYK